MLKSDKQHWGDIAKFFHWAIVLLIIVQGTLGLVMVDLPKKPNIIPIFSVHKSIGMTILFLAVLRLAWRTVDRRPADPAGMPKWQVFGAHAGHMLLYVLIFLVPLSGWWFDSVSGLRPLYWFNLFEIPHMAAPDPALKQLARDRHELLFWVLVVVALGHAAMAFFHQFVDRDGTLARMWPGRRALATAPTTTPSPAQSIAPIPPITPSIPPSIPEESAHVESTAASPIASGPADPADRSAGA